MNQLVLLISVLEAALAGIPFADPNPNAPNNLFGPNPGPGPQGIPLQWAATPLQAGPNTLSPRQLLPQVSNPIVGVIAQSLDLLPVNQPFGLQPLAQAPLGNGLPGNVLGPGR